MYGLNDASRAWYLRVKDELLALGTVMSKFDEAIFYWRNDGELHGIIACHVDDFCWGGSDIFERSVISKLKSTFLIRREDTTAFKYLGLNVVKINGEIHVDQFAYINDISLLDLPSNKSSLDSLDKKEIRSLRLTCGQLNWISSQTRPDIAYESCELSTSIKNATVSNMLYANKVIRKLKNDFVKLRYSSLGDLSCAKLICFSDASFANLQDAGSQGGNIVLLQGQNGNCVPLTWQSRKIRRVVKSTLAAETLSLLECAESAFMLRSLLTEILLIPEIPIICVTDNKSLHDCAYSTKTTTDKRLKVDICIIRNMLLKQEITRIVWTNSEKQLSDCLTKKGASCSTLLNLLNGNATLPSDVTG